jgi:hypothetical protein
MVITRGGLLTAITLASALVACHSNRYIANIRPQPVPAPALFAGELGQLRRVLEETRKDAEAGRLLDGMDERIHVVLDGQVAFTVVLAGGKATVHDGIAAGVTPTLKVPATPQALQNLRAAVADGKLEEGEVFNIAYVLFMPCLRRIHQMWYFQEPGDKRAYKVDNFMHFGLKNPKRFDYHGQKVEVAVTALNVDGFFFYLPGFVGDPDVRYEFEQADAIELYRMLVYEAERKRGDMTGLIALGNKVDQLLTRATTYTRSWH